MGHKKLNRRIARDGFTLLELVAASFVAVAILVPTMSLLRQSMEYGRKIDTRNVMNTLCVAKVEREMAFTASTFQSSTERGSFQAEGYPQIRFETRRSQRSAHGGRNNQLMAIVVTVWDDTNGNRRRNAGEPSITMSTKVAKFKSY